MTVDLEVVIDSELEVAHVEANTEAAIEFIDSIMFKEMHVVDSGRIVVRREDTADLITSALEQGLTISQNPLR